MDSPRKVVDSLLKSIDFVLKMMVFVLKMINFVLKMMVFVSTPTNPSVREICRCERTMFSREFTLYLFFIHLSFFLFILLCVPPFWLISIDSAAPEIEEVRKKNELCIKNEKLRIKNEELCTKDEELCV